MMSLPQCITPVEGLASCPVSHAHISFATPFSNNTIGDRSRCRRRGMCRLELEVEGEAREKYEDGSGAGWCSAGGRV